MQYAAYTLDISRNARAEICPAVDGVRTWHQVKGIHFNSNLNACIVFFLLSLSSIFNANETLSRSLKTTLIIHTLTAYCFRADLTNFTTAAAETAATTVINNIINQVLAWIWISIFHMTANTKWSEITHSDGTFMLKSSRIIIDVDWHQPYTNNNNNENQCWNKLDTGENMRTNFLFSIHQFRATTRRIQYIVVGECCEWNNKQQNERLCWYFQFNAFLLPSFIFLSHLRINQRRESGAESIKSNFRISYKGSEITNQVTMVYTSTHATVTYF